MLGRFTLRPWHKLADLEEEVWVVLDDDDVLSQELEPRITAIDNRAYHIQRKYRKWPFCVRVPSSGTVIRSLLKLDSFTYGPTRVLSYGHCVDHPWPRKCLTCEQEPRNRGMRTWGHSPQRPTRPGSLLERPRAYLGCPLGRYAGAGRWDEHSLTQRETSIPQRGACLLG